MHPLKDTWSLFEGMYSMPLLNWSDRDEDLTRSALTPYRLLEPVASLSYGEVDAPNMLIEGDNLDALKALLPYYAGQVGCVYIDPPFNTGAMFPKYDDNFEHSIWLSMMYARLELIHELVSEKGSLFLHLDDNEVDYAKVMLDEIFGRSNFVNRITIAARSPSAFSTVNPGVFKASEYILWYAKNKEKFEDVSARIPRGVDYAYNLWLENRDLPESEWRFSSLADKYAEVPRNARIKHPKSILQHFDKWVLKNSSQVCRLASISDSGAGQAIVDLKKESLSRPGEVLKLERGESLDTVYILDGQQILFYSKNVVEIDGEPVASSMLTNIWSDISWEGIAGEGGVTFKKGKKPERLLRRCIELTTKPGDLVLDSFLGSGTTAAVALKLNRRFVGIERGDQARSHCQARLVSVVEGEQSGISKEVGWKGGGGFRFYKLGVPVFDDEGHIRDGIKFEHLAAHVWFAETGAARSTRAPKQSFLGEHHGIGYYLLFNGILGDESKTGGNVLTKRVLKGLQPFDGPKVIYGESCDLPKERLEELQITFKQTPYDIKAR
ncbi:MULTISPECIES: site-specific DNA-methyltransferase [Stenotrophomonas]|uniref:site-specific DNA-methyltransferase (adenine-specific) n=1 Tax=Stenotrophomonas maltophilia TaxID=40324 RepID=A0AAI9C172_STEMA|nr:MULTISPECIES: site-specific DNA-methyltransferase [Stenotrophomonas]EKT4092220.1 site-specific DNA-methyltransferase [Stenotrophomonas maltophilia]ELF4098912.1 site-specific DNA-methyltransferase [Stenotrophomonas maltophilia]MBH1388522.1 site-specific DNA-methyltransferase [Stenotrophomonas maltophilia]MBH1648027.1 site-specific DNA-methyltransferase [Stenotrophomonas maltophilia]MBN4977304.1 site-specific DNA-methyltransferase [Stenotrophomonas maltophilia]